MNVRKNPTKMSSAASRLHQSEYIRPVIFGHQKCSPAKYAEHHPADHHEVEVGDDEVRVVQVDVRAASAARNSPVSPPMVNSTMNASAKQHRGLERDRPAVQRAPSS